MSRVFEVVTPEQVGIRYELAGFGSRALAAALDALYQGLLFIVLLTIISLLLSNQIGELDSWKAFANSIVIGIGIIAFFLIFWGYHIAFELFWNGETPGKRAMRLRVIKDGGHPVDFRAVVIRNLLRTADMLPPITYGLGLVSILCTEQYKRLGDLAAGTLVVRHGRDEDPREQFTFGEAVVYRLLDASVLSQLARMTRDEHRLVQRFLEKRHALQQPLRTEFARRLATPLMEKFHYQLPPLGIDYERWLDELDLAFRTRTLGPIFTPVSAPPVATPLPVETPRTDGDEDDDVRKW